jgi:hypothetical protein
VSFLAALVAALAVAGPPLKTVSRPSYRVSVPATWRFVDASYPSDHSTHVWYDPANPLRRLIVSQTPCVGCIDGIHDLRKASQKTIRSHLPGTPDRIWVESSTRVRFLSFDTDPWNRVYPDNGLLIVRPKGPLAETYVHLWLPASQHALALQMLHTFDVP